MHRQPSRNTANMDAIDCNVNTNDLALEAEVLKQDDYRSKSRRDQPPKRSNDSSTHRSNRHSPPSVTRKHHPSPPSRSHHQHQHHHYPSQRPHRPPPSRSRSPSPPSSPLPQPSSRPHRPPRPVVSSKRPYPASESPRSRHYPPTHRSRQELPPERTTTNAAATSEEARLPYRQETADLSLISEDESTKTRDTRSNSTKANDSSSILTSNQLHSTPSIPKTKESLLEVSNIPLESELSLLAGSTLSTTNLSSNVPPTSRNSNIGLMAGIDLISKYKAMEAVPSNNPEIQALSRDILISIHKQIQLEKLEIDHREREMKLREREMKLRERELAEREKNLKIKSGEINSTMSEPFVITKPNIIEESTPVKSEHPINHDLINVSPDESVSKSIPPTVDTSKVKSTTKTSDQSTAARKTRFSQLIVDPSIFSSQAKPTLELYSDELNVPDQSISPSIGTDLKITSSSTCRKVEIQSGNTDKSGSKEPTGDLRLTLGKRSKQHNNDQLGTNGEPTINDLEPSLNNNDNKQQSHDYQQQRSVTSASIDTIIDDTNDKRDVRRHRQQPYPSNNNQRPYIHGSTSKYGSNQKRNDNEDDLRSRIFDHKHPKSSRTTHKNNY